MNWRDSVVNLFGMVLAMGVVFVISKTIFLDKIPMQTTEDLIMAVEIAGILALLSPHIMFIPQRVFELVRQTGTTTNTNLDFWEIVKFLLLFAVSMFIVVLTVKYYPNNTVK